MTTVSTGSRSTQHRRLRALGAGLLIAALSTLATNSGVSPANAASASLVISEFRLRGAAGAADEFIEIQNISTSDVTVTSTGSGSGYAIVASDLIVRCVIPNGTVIPRYGHFLCANSIDYSLGAYPAGHSTSANADDTYTIEIADNVGIAIFDTDETGNFTAPHRFDSVGSDAETDALYREGAGYPAIAVANSNQSFVRNLSNPQINAFGLATATPGISEDTDDNATDFVFVDVASTTTAAGHRLGAPGPENLSSPVVNGGMTVSLVDDCVDANTAPNAVRDLTSNPSGNATVGTVEFRRTITNNTGGSVNRLRVRIADLRTNPAVTNFADMRALTTADSTATVDRAPCGTGTSTVDLRGTTLEEPAIQVMGGGFNSSFGAGFVTLAAPLANGASIDLRMLFGLEQHGYDSVNFVVEALTAGTVTAPSLTCAGASDGATITSFCSGLPPVANSDSYSVGHNTILTVANPGVLTNDTEPESQSLSVVTGSVSSPVHGGVVMNANGAFVYTPTAGYGGADSFTYRITDGLNLSAPATVTLTVAANQAPTAANDAFTVNEDTPLVVGPTGLLTNDSDPEAQAITVKTTTVTLPSHGTLSVSTDGSFSYTPAANFHGSDSFTYRVMDAVLESNVATATITVTAVNDSPTAGPDTGMAIQNAPFTSPAPGPLANDTDSDGDPLVAVLVTPPTHGTLVLNPDGSYIYTPTVGYTGPDSFTYAASDGIVSSSPVTVTLTVNGATVVPLPTTGADVITMLSIAAGLLLLGGTFLIVRRRWAD